MLNPKAWINKYSQNSSANESRNTNNEMQTTDISIVIRLENCSFFMLDTGMPKVNTTIETGSKKPIFLLLMS